MVIYDARPSPFTQLTAVADWESLFSAAGIVDGIDGSSSAFGITALVPSFDVPGRNIVIGPGNLIIQGQLWRCDASVSTAIPAASAQNRIDRLVMRYNRGASTSPTVIQPTIISGTPSGSPVEPPLVQTPTGLFDIPVCSWTATSAGALTGLLDERYFSADGWHSVSLPSTGGFTGNIRVKRLSMVNLCMLDVAIRWTATTATLYSAGALPTGYYPTVQRHYTGSQGGVPGDSTSPAIIIPVSGALQVYTVSDPSGSGTADWYGGGFLYPVD